MDEKTIQRFESKINRLSDTDCWLWESGLRAGYGRFCSHGNREGAHCVSFKHWRGKIPDGLCVLHKCDVCNCVNPEHLFLGTRGDNNRDRHAKGRNAARNGSAKLAESDVLEIRRRYAAGGITQAQLGREYGVSPTAISNIVTRKYWAQLVPPSPKSSTSS